ncbi:MAG: hypothetical protein B7X60_02640 [Polynucleobacter sp. 39-45-136]|jgi:hypothetical protein|nr:MAG: hypothetical protein B7X60_02640 [Polynucleobacter sp. 39-45-136]
MKSFYMIGFFLSVLFLAGLYLYTLFVSSSFSWGWLLAGFYSVLFIFYAGYKIKTSRNKSGGVKQ